MRIALIIEYDGSAFHGWQIQSNLRTVQGELEKSLSLIANHPVEITCAGRTDAGVHAKYQVAHFDTHATRAMSAWTLGTNHYLAKDISVHRAVIMPDDFHARFSAISRSYEYWIDNRPTRPALQRDQITWQPRLLDENLMHRAAQFLVGEHDFSSFRGIDCQAKHPIRTITKINVERQGHFVIVKITANAFLHHMVRNIVGTLMPVGFGSKPTEWLIDVLQSKKRAVAGATALPNGLYLCDVCYETPYEELLKRL